MAIRTELSDVTKVDHRRALSATECEQHRKVAVGGDDGEAIGDCVVEDLGVGLRDQVQVPDMGHVVTRITKRLKESRRQVCVEQKPHAGRATGTSRSFTTTDAYSRAASTSSRSRYG